ncbi:MAG: endonuclease III [Clostridiales bacterium]|nr:endonuclease III [Clostridiales bacterium]
MNGKETAVLKLLDEHYPFDFKCFLMYDKDKPWQLLFATILSAQCTDVRVNAVTKTLFKKYSTLDAFARADLTEMQRDIFSTGFYRGKAVNIISSARRLLDEHGGRVPSDLDALVKLPGVGRKTANVVRGHIFRIPSVVVDTHVKRVSKRLGFTESEDPTKIESDLMNILPEKHWIAFNQQIITHGRRVCVARRPSCGDCFLRVLCDF